MIFTMIYTMINTVIYKMIYSRIYTIIYTILYNYAIVGTTIAQSTTWQPATMRRHRVDMQQRLRTKGRGGVVLLPYL